MAVLKNGLRPEGGGLHITFPGADASDNSESLEITPTGNGYECELITSDQDTRHELLTVLRYHSIAGQAETHRVTFPIAAKTFEEAMRNTTSLMRGWWVTSASYYFYVDGSEHSFGIEIFEELPATATVQASFIGRRFDDPEAYAWLAIEALMTTGLCATAHKNDVGRELTIELAADTGLSRFEHLQQVAQAFPLPR